MTDSTTPLSAKAKIALSRSQILAAMGYEEVQGAPAAALKVIALPKSRRTSALSNLGDKIGQSVVGSWYRRSAISTALQLAEPVLKAYARKHPAKLVAYAAGTGALLWVAKPWRLLSITTVLGLILNSSRMSDVEGRPRS
ncbi:hypothetical protein QTI51_37775 [Variovorax sp. J22G73]|uniref:hypothetical protein n=1 Tax=unclassified Variovorax TaxID=663243 RepID=UPI0025779177|nr:MULTISPECIES: hypothetical protein [unclassified Variovorax]MDM0010595.1 hypothetical protein [Variovorax sp. J22R203]MDM0103076.1 hypothetical protein [Variovorax sp. J22G73]